MMKSPVFILCACVAAGQWHGVAQSAGDAGGLVNPPEPITTNVPARPMTAAPKVVAKPTGSTNANTSAPSSSRPKGFMKPGSSNEEKAPAAKNTETKPAAQSPQQSVPTMNSIELVGDSGTSSAVNPDVVARQNPAAIAPAVGGAEEKNSNQQDLDPAPTNTSQVKTSPEALPVQPVIPGFDPAPFLAAEKAVVETITNTAPADEVILELKYDDIELLDLIKSLALQAELNILFDPTLVNPTGADGLVAPQPIVPAFRMTNVTAKQALEAILDNYSYQMIHDPKTKTFRITTKTGPIPEPMFTRIITLRYTNPTNLVQVLQAVVTEKGSVTPYSRTQQLIISATDDHWKLVNELLDQLDKPVKQVLIEANIMETARNPQSIRGVDWTGTLQAQSFGFGNGSVSGTVTQNRPGTTTTATETLPSGRTVTTSSTAGSSTTESIAGAVGGAVGGLVPGLSLNTRDGLFPTVAFLNADGVRGILSFLNSDSQTEVIATPRAVMMDGQLARLEVTRAFPIFLITPGSANSPAGASISYTNMGTILEVTPTVVADDHVQLRVTPEVSNIDGKDVQTINGEINEANIYAIRRIETNVRVPSGHTLVMGGLINETKTQADTKVPILGDIPGLGWAFRRQQNLRRKQNLLIFITPTILDSEHFQPPQTDFLNGANQPTADDFLRTRVPERKPETENFMDSAQPHDFKKKKSGFFKWGDGR